MTEAYDIIAHAVTLLEGGTVARSVTAGMFAETNIEDAQSALAGAGKPYPVIVEPATVSWSWPMDYTTVAVDQRWDRVAFAVDVYLTPHSLDPMETNRDLADIAYEIRRTLSDPASWLTSIAGFVSVDLEELTVDSIDTDYEGAGQQVDFIYVIRQPVSVTYREDHS